MAAPWKSEIINKTQRHLATMPLPVSLAPLQTICSIYSLHTARFGGAKRRYKSHLTAIYSAPLRLTFSAASNARFWPTLVTSQPQPHLPTTFPPFICRLLRAEAGERKQFNSSNTLVTFENFFSRIFKKCFLWNGHEEKGVLSQCGVLMVLKHYSHI